MGRRVLAPLLFALACLCFLLPFGTARCGSDLATVSGIDLVANDLPTVRDEAGRPDPESDLGRQIVDAASGLATLGLVLAATAGALALVGVGVVTQAAALVVGWAAFGSLVLLALKVFLTSSAAADLRLGYWLALGLIGAGSAVVGSVWRRSRWPIPRLELTCGLAGGLLLLSANVVPFRRPEADHAPSSILEYLIPEHRELLFWQVFHPVLLALGTLVATLMLGSPKIRRLAAGVLLALGAASLVSSVATIGFSAREDDSARGVGDGAYVYLAGSMLAVAAGLIAVRTLRRERRAPAGRGVAAPLMSVAGAAVMMLGGFLDFVQFDVHGEVEGRAILERFSEEMAWIALELVVTTLLVVVLALALLRRPGERLSAGALTGLGAASALYFVGFLEPALDDSPLTSLRAGAFVGIAGSLLVLVSGVLEGVRAAKESAKGAISSTP